MLSRIVGIVALMVALSACAGGTRDVPAPTAHADSPSDITDSAYYSERDYQEERAERSSERRHHARHHRDHDHYHEGPTPGEAYAARVALALSAQVFACAFFVVILDGSCHFYASTGYYY